jgi:MFS family permease
VNIVQIRLWDPNLKVRLLGEGLFNMLFWMYFPFITVYFGEALGNHIAGVLMTVPPLFSMLGSLLGGALTDRIGRRPVMLIGSFLQTIMFVFFALSPSHWIDFIAFIGIGLGGSIYRPASSAMVADLVPEQNLRQVFATFATVNNIGAVLGPLLGSIFFFQYRQELLWTCSLVLLLYFIAIFYMVHETNPLTVNSKKEPKSITYVLKEQWIGYGIIFKDRIFLLYILAGIFALVPIMQLDLYLPVYVINEVPSQSLFPWIDQSIRLTSTEIFGWILGFNGLLFVLFVLPVTKWFQNWKERNVFILSSLLAGFGTFFVGIHSNIWFLFAVTLIFTFGELVRSPVTQSFISRYAPEQSRGQYMAADSLQYTIGKCLSPLTVFLSSWFAPIGIFSLILIFSLISIWLYYQLFDRYERKLSDTLGI